MCGIAGWFGPAESVIDSAIIKDMVDSMRYRGPDSYGLHEFDGGILGHTRLAIVGVRRGEQPMNSEDGQVHACVNGEVYNYRALKKELENVGHEFSLDTDAEVHLHGYEMWGYDIFSRVNGMFAVALYDETKALGILARDRWGIKPLYYVEYDGGILFASEIMPLARAVHELSGPLSVNTRALALYMKLRYIPHPYTAFTTIHSLPPASMLIYKPNQGIKVTRWASSITPRNVDILDNLKASVSARTMGEVPMGVFLSGGLDSTSIAILARDVKQFHAFNIDFGNGEEDSRFAHRVADDFGFPLKTTISTPEDIFMLPELINTAGQPMGDPAIVPTYKLSKLAASMVKYVLTGEGSDEIFGGYDYYFTREKALSLSHMIPSRLRKIAALRSVIMRLPPIPGSRTIKGSFLASDAETVASMMGYFSDEEVHSVLGYSPNLTKHIAGLGVSDSDPLGYQMAVDMAMWLPDDLLTKVDVASMRASLEARVPFLDDSVVSAVLYIPPEKRTGESRRKVALKKALKNTVPDYILSRKKAGFDVPVEAWLKHGSSLVEEAYSALNGHYPAASSLKTMKGLAGHQRKWLLTCLGLWLESAGGLIQ